MRSDSSPRAVSMITGRRERDRIQRQSSSPSVPGSMTSSTTRSGGSRFEQLARPVSVRRLERLEAVAFQVADDDLADRRLVVDDENLGHDRIMSEAALRVVNSARGAGGGILPAPRPKRSAARDLDSGDGPAPPIRSGGEISATGDSFMHTDESAFRFADERMVAARARMNAISSLFSSLPASYAMTERVSSWPRSRSESSPVNRRSCSRAWSERSAGWRDRSFPTVYVLERSRRDRPAAP